MVEPPRLGRPSLWLPSQRVQDLASDEGRAPGPSQDPFQGTQVNITTHGHPHLGAALGSKDFIDQFVSDRVQRWTQELLILSDIAKSQPHAAHAAFTHGYVHKFSFLCRTIPNIETHLHPLEDCIRSNFIPSLTGRSPQMTWNVTFSAYHQGWEASASPIQPCYPPESSMPLNQFQHP